MDRALPGTRRSRGALSQQLGDASRRAGVVQAGVAAKWPPSSVPRAHVRLGSSKGASPEASCKKAEQRAAGGPAAAGTHARGVLHYPVDPNSFAISLRLNLSVHRLRFLSIRASTRNRSMLALQRATGPCLCFNVQSAPAPVGTEEVRPRPFYEQRRFLSLRNPSKRLFN